LFLLALLGIFERAGRAQDKKNAMEMEMRSLHSREMCRTFGGLEIYRLNIDS